MKKNSGITLIALVITIIILLILAGISIASLTQSGLFRKAKESKIVSIRSEMKEKLTLAISELQIEKKGDATLDDITQEWVDEKIAEYTNKVTKDATLNAKKVTMNKNGIRGRFIIDGKFNITEETGIDFSYEVIEKNGSNINISITVRDEENRISKIELPGKEPLTYDNVEEVNNLEYVVELGKEYTVTITTGDGEAKRVKILIEPEIEVTEAYINTTQNATSSLEANSVERGPNSLYISFIATLEGETCTIEPALTNAIVRNGKYTYTITGEYNGKTVTKTKEVIVNQFKSAIGLVQYDAGEWTREEIEELNRLKLYVLNETHSHNNSFRLKEERGLALTFGGFTYKGDTGNENKEGVITSRNNSVGTHIGTPKYEGWQILESEEREGKTYVTKLVHAGSPENFVYGYDEDLSYRAIYLLTGKLQDNNEKYKKLSDGETMINLRDWNMYRDKELDKKGYIKNIHCMTYEEALKITGDTEATESLRDINAYYWLGTSMNEVQLWCIEMGGRIIWTNGYSYGIRPVIELNEGVYIESGDGTGTNPYVLGKD